jgi:predicted TIM-barrel fold metal-dependent hydrolase
MARDANDRIHEAMKAHPTRFAGFASLATADPAEAVKELERCVGKLGFKGTMINGHTQGSYLDDKKYWGILEAAQALDVPVYIHPREPHPAVLKAYFEGFPELQTAAWGFAMETCTHFMRMIFAGVFDAFPRLKIILGHLGEGIPFWLDRFEDHTRFAMVERGLKKTPRQYMTENLVITCSGNFSVPSLLCSVMTLGIDNVMFSVDWPYESNRIGVDFLNRLPFAEADKAKIAHGNAERILKL